MAVGKLPALFFIAVINALTFSNALGFSLPPTGPCRPGCSAQDVPESLIRSMNDECELASSDDPFFYLKCFMRDNSHASCLGLMKLNPDLPQLKEQCTTIVELFCCPPVDVKTTVPTVGPVTTPPPTITSTCGNPERATIAGETTTVPTVGPISTPPPIITSTSGDHERGNTAAEITEKLPDWVVPSIVAVAVTCLFLGMAVGALSYHAWISRRSRTEAPVSDTHSEEDSTRGIVDSIKGGDFNDTESGFETATSLSQDRRTDNNSQDFGDATPAGSQQAHQVHQPDDGESMDTTS